ncbi:hypothetical protein ACFQV2_25740 [Actinokineospora soli]|uniref:Uncharacterized protein n=1 Tax=Actinokineospora soli TaxID=1048753 RepID=A0ABW2TSB5_9PSEU
MHADVRYASLVAEPDPAFEPEWLGVVGQGGPGSTAGGVVLTVENGLLHLSFGSIGGTPIPTDPVELQAFADRAVAPVVAEALRRSTPVGPVRAFRVRRTTRRHYDRLRDAPAGSSPSATRRARRTRSTGRA